MKSQKLTASGYLCAMICLFMNFSTATAQTMTPKYVSTSGNSNAFYEYLPQSYSIESQSYPLLVFLHGVGELGDGSSSSLPTVLRNGPPKLINDGTFPTSFTVNGQTFKFIVICPQFINWPSPNDVSAVIDYAVRTYRVNTNRIYLTGLSMGGGGAWDYASATAAYANRIAALVPVCGASGSTPQKSQVIASANLPVWATHNQVDPTVSPDNTIGWIAAINSASPPPSVLARKTIFNASGHDAWTATYTPNFKENNLNIYEWMLQYQRGTSQPVNQLPVVDAGSDVYLTLPSNSVNLSGSATDPDGNITGYSWSRVSGPTQFAISNSGVRNPTISNLAAGTYTFRLTTTDNGGASNYDDINIIVTAAGVSLPGRIEAENYTAMSGVQTENTSDAGGGKNVGFIDVNDWMDYSIAVPTAGIYTVSFRVAAPSASQVILRSSSGGTLATVAIPSTGGYINWTTVTTTVTLPAGNQTVRVVSGAGGWNFNWFEFSSGSSTPGGIAIPGKIEAENYSSMSGVQKETTSDAGGGQDVGFIDTGDWMDYAVTASSAGTYTVNVRLATPYSSQQLLLKNASGTTLATVNIPQTGAYQNWTTVTASITLPAGNQTIRVQSANGGWNFNWIEFVSGTPLPVGNAIPGRIEAESYSNMSGIQNEGTSDAGGGQNVGFIDTGDWMDYNATVSTAGTYTVNFRVASPYASPQLQLKNSSGTVLATVNVPQTGAFQAWTTVSATVTLPAGSQTLRVYISNGGWNFNWMEFVSGAGAPTGAPIPGKIEAENYSTMSGVTAENTSDVNGGKNIGFIDTGDWMDYSTTVSTAGTYTVNLRVATPNSSQQLQIKNASGTVLATINLTNTGAYQNWTTVSGSLTLPAGNQTLRVQSTNGGWNFNWIEFVSGTGAPAGAPIPGKIEAENYSSMNGIATEPTSDAGGGLNVGWIASGDWMDYNTTVAAAGNYTASFRVATSFGGQTLQLRNSSGTVLGTLNVPQTGGFQTWSTASMVVNLPAGNQTLRIYASNGSWNINWFQFVSGGTLPNASAALSASAIADQDLNTKAAFTVFPNPVQDKFSLTMNNSQLGAVDIKIADQSGKIIKTFKFEKTQQVSQFSIPASELTPGIYFMKVQVGTWIQSKKILKL